MEQNIVKLRVNNPLKEDYLYVESTIPSGDPKEIPPKTTTESLPFDIMNNTVEIDFYTKKKPITFGVFELVSDVYLKRLKEVIFKETEAGRNHWRLKMVWKDHKEHGKGPVIQSPGPVSEPNVEAGIKE